MPGCLHRKNLRETSALSKDAFRLNVLLGAAALTKRHGCVKQRTTNDQTKNACGLISVLASSDWD